MQPLRFSFATRAREEVEAIGQWLAGHSSEAATRFSETVDALLPSLCQEIAEQIETGSRPAGQIDEIGSLAFAQPVRLHIFTTQKKRARRSTVGTYRLYFTLLDTNQDGQVDTLRVLSVRHAAARPIWDVDRGDE